MTESDYRETIIKLKSIYFVKLAIFELEMKKSGKSEVTKRLLKSYIRVIEDLYKMEDKDLKRMENENNEQR